MEVFVEKGHSMTLLHLSLQSEEEVREKKLIKTVISRLTFVERDDYKLYVSA